MHTSDPCPTLLSLETTAGAVHRRRATNWVWAVAQPPLAVFSILPSRARYVIHDLIGKKPGAFVVSDRFAGYAHIDASRRQVCWAHLLSDFNRMAERQGLAGRIGARLLGLGYVLFRWRDKGKTAAQFVGLQRRVHSALIRGIEQTVCRRTKATCQNLINIWDALWGFVHNPLVPPINNDAERAIRGIVLKRKISGPTRSRRGDELIARGFSAYESCLRQGRDFIDYMHRAVLAWIDKAPHPSLLPPLAAPTG
jgi:transposase